MIYITNKKLLKKVDDLSKEEVKEFIYHLEVVAFLLKKFGKRLNTSSFYDLLKKNVDIYYVWSFLKSINKLNLKDLKEIIDSLKGRFGLDKVFYVKINDDDNKISSIAKIIKEKFGDDVVIQKDKYDKIGLFVKWLGYYYKRDLNSDLNKLLR